MWVAWGHTSCVSGPTLVKRLFAKFMILCHRNKSCSCIVAAMLMKAHHLLAKQREIRKVEGLKRHLI